MSESNHKVIASVMRAMTLMAITGFATLCACLIISLFCKVNPVDQNLVVAFLTVLNGVVGWLGGSLTKTSATTAAPTETKIVNPKNEPVNTTEV